VNIGLEIPRCPIEVESANGKAAEIGADGFLLGLTGEALKEKLLDQLAIDLSVLTRLFGDLVIGELALTGSDPFLHDGSDVALILQVKSRPVFQVQMDRYRKEAKSAGPTRRTPRRLTRASRSPSSLRWSLRRQWSRASSPRR
jgi:hypothetical protein